MKIKSFLYAIILFSLAFIPQSQANTKISRGPIPSWVRTAVTTPKDVNLEDISQGYYYERIEYQVNLGLDTKFFRETKVLFDSNGAENAGQVYIPFDPNYQRLIMHELKVIRDGHPLDKLDINKFEVVATETDLARFIYNGTYSAYLILDDLRKGDKIVISYSLAGVNPVFSQKFFDKFNLRSYEPVGLVHVNYVVPEGRKLNFKMHNGAPQPNLEKTSNTTSYYWEVSSQDAVEFPDYAPSWYTALPWGECSEYTSWNEVAQWAKTINPITPLKKGSALADLVNQYWNESNGNSYKFVQKVTDFVQNDVRYMGVEMGEYSHRANLPEKVFSQRYGDCKDKSVLMVSMLSHMGIKSSLVLASTVLEHTVARFLPTPMAFNHMTVWVEIAGNSLYIDPTITDQSGAINERYFPNYGSVLVLNNSEYLTKLPSSHPGSSDVTETYILNEKGGATLEVKTVYRGSDADFIRTYFKTNARNLIQKEYLSYYQRIHPKVKTRTPLKYEDHLQQNNIAVFENYDIEKIGEFEKEKGKRLLGIYANQLDEKLLHVNPTESVAPIALNYPSTFKYTIKIINSGQIPFYEIKKATHFNRNAYNFSKIIQNSNDTLLIRYQFEPKTSYVPLEEKEQYLSDFSNRNELLYTGFYLEENGVIYGSNNDKSFSFVMIAYALICLGVMGFAIIRYNKTAASNLIPIYKRTPYKTISGWLILLLITLITSTLIQIYTMCISGIFTKAIWSTLEIEGAYIHYFYKILLICEFTFNLFSICGFSYAIYLLINRRDIFPQTLFFIMIVKIVGLSIISYGAYHIEIFHLVPNLLTDNLKQIAFCVIWGSYVYFSDRVKNTFVVAYSEHNNNQLELTDSKPNTQEIDQ